MRQYACPDCGLIKNYKGLCTVCELRAKVELEVAAFKEQCRLEDEEADRLAAEVANARGFGKRWR